MGTSRAGRQGDIGAVIHEDGGRKGVDQRPRQLQDVGRCAIFPPDLYHRGAALHRGATHSHGIPPLEQIGIRDHHQAQLIDERHDQSPARAPRRNDRDRKYE